MSSNGNYKNALSEYRGLCREFKNVKVKLFLNHNDINLKQKLIDLDRSIKKYDEAIVKTKEPVGNYQQGINLKTYILLSKIILFCAMFLCILLMMTEDAKV